MILNHFLPTISHVDPWALCVCGGGGLAATCVVDLPDHLY